MDWLLVLLYLSFCCLGFALFSGFGFVCYLRCFGFVWASELMILIVTTDFLACDVIRLFAGLLCLFGFYIRCLFDLRFGLV